MPEPRTPYFDIRLEGETISPWVQSVSVVEDDRQADNVSITIPDPRMIYADGLFEGSVVEVDIGYAAPSAHALMLRATITHVELRYPNNGIPTLTLKGEDKSIDLGLVEKRKKWSGRTVTDIVRAVAEPYRFADVVTSLDPDPMIEREPIQQDGKTDLAFLQELAREYKAKCFVELDENGEEVLYFIPERQVLTSRRVDRLPLRYRLGPDSNLITFSPRFDSSYIDRLKEINDVDDDGNSFASQDREETDIFLWQLDEQRLSLASPPDRDTLRSLYRTGAARKADLQRRLAARRAVSGDVVPNQAEMEGTNVTLQSRHLGMTASGSTFGNILLRAKSIIVTEGLSERWNGEWYVCNVTHKIDNNGFKSDFRCVR